MCSAWNHGFELRADIEANCPVSLEPCRSPKLGGRCNFRKEKIRRSEVLATLASGLLISGCGPAPSSTNNSAGASAQPISQAQAGQGLIVFYRRNNVAGSRRNFKNLELCQPQGISTPSQVFGRKP